MSSEEVAKPPSDLIGGSMVSFDEIEKAVSTSSRAKRSRLIRLFREGANPPLKSDKKLSSRFRRRSVDGFF
ncbi:hypothetical protein ACOSQ3_023790 [Xanthoceras sorbifolium]